VSDSPIRLERSTNYWPVHPNHRMRILPTIRTRDLCRHPNVVRLYGYCLEPPTVCLILELLPTSLKELLYGAPSGTSEQREGSTRASPAGSRAFIAVPVTSSCNGSPLAMDCQVPNTQASEPRDCMAGSPGTPAFDSHLGNSASGAPSTPMVSANRHSLQRQLPMRRAQHFTVKKVLQASDGALRPGFPTVGMGFLLLCSAIESISKSTAIVSSNE
jgi:hypothetical protein